MAKHRYYSYTNGYSKELNLHEKLISNVQGRNVLDRCAEAWVMRVYACVQAGVPMIMEHFWDKNLNFKANDFERLELSQHVFPNMTCMYHSTVCIFTDSCIVNRGSYIPSATRTHKHLHATYLLRANKSCSHLLVVKKRPIMIL